MQCSFSYLLISKAKGRGLKSPFLYQPSCKFFFHVRMSWNHLCIDAVCVNIMICTMSFQVPSFVCEFFYEFASFHDVLLTIILYAFMRILSMYNTHLYTLFFIPLGTYEFLKRFYFTQFFVGPVFAVMVGSDGVDGIVWNVIICKVVQRTFKISCKFL